MVTPHAGIGLVNGLKKVYVADDDISQISSTLTARADAYRRKLMAAARVAALEEYHVRRSLGEPGMARHSLFIDLCGIDNDIGLLNGVVG